MIKLKKNLGKEVAAFPLELSRWLATTDGELLLTGHVSGWEFEQCHLTKKSSHFQKILPQNQIDVIFDEKVC